MPGGDFADGVIALRYPRGAVPHPQNAGLYHLATGGATECWKRFWPLPNLELDVLRNLQFIHAPPAIGPYFTRHVRSKG